MTGEKKNRNEMNMDEKAKCMKCEEGVQTTECDWCKMWMN